MYKCLLLWVLILTPLYGEALVVSDLFFQGCYVPGSTSCITIHLTNDSDHPEQVEFRIVDYGCNSEGQHFFDPAGSRNRSNATWLTVHPKQTLAPREEAEVYVTLRVPDDVTLQGSYWSVLLIAPSAVAQSIQTAGGPQVQIRFQYGYHIVTDVGEGQAKLKILDKGYKRVGDRDFLAFDIVNVGDLFLRPKFLLSLFDQRGKLVKYFAEQVEKLYPDNPQRFLIDPAGVPAGKYKAFLAIDNGDSHLFGDSFSLEIRDSTTF